LADLWDSHVVLRELANTARAPLRHHLKEMTADEPTAPWMLPA
jgi:hypothetical protein